jgi:hypothetical protein
LVTCCSVCLDNISVDQPMLDQHSQQPDEPNTDTTPRRLS